MWIRWTWNSNMNRLALLFNLFLHLFISIFVCFFISFHVEHKKKEHLLMRPLCRKINQHNVGVPNNHRFACLSGSCGHNPARRMSWWFPCTLDSCRRQLLQLRGQEHFHYHPLFELLHWWCLPLQLPPCYKHVVGLCSMWGPMTL